MKPTRAQLERQIERAERHLAQRARTKASQDAALVQAQQACERGEATLRQAVLAKAVIDQDSDFMYSCLGVMVAFAMSKPATHGVASPFLHVLAYPPDVEPPGVLVRTYTELWDEYLDSVCWMQEWSDYFTIYNFSDETISGIEHRRTWVFHLLVVMGERCAMSARKMIWEKIDGQWQVRPELSSMVTGQHRQIVELWTEISKMNRIYDFWRRTEQNAPDLPR